MTDAPLIAILDDEPEIRRLLSAALEEAGFRTAAFARATEFEAALKRMTLDVCLVDLGLPDRDGLAVVHRLALESGASIIIISGRAQVQDRVTGLELGADDYLVKPFAFAELLARVRTLLRRGAKGKEAETLRAADLDLDLIRRRVTRAGKRIELTAKEFALLELLLRRRGEVLPRSLIASQVWDMNFDSDTNVIEVAVRRLRAKVDDAFEPKLIRTVRGMGYVLEAAEPAPR